MSNEDPALSEGGRYASVDDLRLWDAVNDYATSTGGDVEGTVYGNTLRQRAVVAVEEAVHLMSRRRVEAAQAEGRAAAYAEIVAMIQERAEMILEVVPEGKDHESREVLRKTACGFIALMADIEARAKEQSDE